MLNLKFLVFVLIVLLFVVFLQSDLIRWLDINFFLNKKAELLGLYDKSPVLFILSFFCIYVFCATFSIPGAALLTLFSGFLFNFIIGSLVVSLGSTLGAAFSFLISRFLMKDFIQRKFAKRLKIINMGLKKDGIFYLFSLRLIPILPFFLINSLMGVTSISLKQFTIGSFLGMLPGTFVYVNAGKQLAHISYIQEIFSKEVILSFLLLALFPWIIKFIFKLVKKTKAKLAKL